MRIVALALLVLQSTAQGPPPQTQPPRFKSGVELVQVDLVVVDANGQPIRGLKAEDFTVLDRGRQASIAAFEEVDHPAPVGPVPPLEATIDVADNTSAQSERVVVVVIDDLRIFKGRTEAARDIARKVVTRIAPGASMALFSTSAQQKVELTRDRALLMKTIDQIEPYQARRKPVSGGAGRSISQFEPVSPMASNTTDMDLLDLGHNLMAYDAVRAAARALASSETRRRRSSSFPKAWASTSAACSTRARRPARFRTRPST